MVSFFFSFIKSYEHFYILKKDDLSIGESKRILMREKATNSVTLKVYRFFKLKTTTIG